MTQSELRPVKNWPGYFVSIDGKVYSSKRKGKDGGMLEMSLGKNKWGYQQVMLRNQSRYMSKAVHRLVIEAFKGPCPEGLECRHLDGNCLNNHADNLQWGTREENMKDKALHGKTASGENAGMSKLTSVQVNAIRTIYTTKRLTHSELAALSGVSQSAITQILTNRTWVV